MTEDPPRLTDAERAAAETEYCIAAVAAFGTEHPEFEPEHLEHLALWVYVQRHAAAQDCIYRTRQDATLTGTPAFRLEQRHCQQVAQSFVVGNFTIPRPREVELVTSMLMEQRSLAIQKVLDESHLALADAVATIEGMVDPGVAVCIGCALKMSRAQMAEHVLTCRNHPFHTIIQTLRDALFHTIEQLGGDTMMGQDWTNEKLIAEVNKTLDYQLEQDADYGKRIKALTAEGATSKDSLAAVAKTMRDWAAQLRGSATESAAHGGSITGRFIAEAIEQKLKEAGLE